jgi:hypothetical protein
MGTATSLSAITIIASEEQQSAGHAADAAGQLSAAQTKAAELIVALTNLVNSLPGGDPNITTINTLITNLS